jgi:folate-dependent tRNA-U54 methylase TrmFO/GidA
VRHLTERSPSGFQPANISWGLIAAPPQLAAVRSRRERRERHAEHALASIAAWAATLGACGA